MSRRSLCVVRPISGLPSRQTSHPTGFDRAARPTSGRGRGAPWRPAGVRAPAVPQIDRDGFLAFWSGLLMRRLGTVPQIARAFERTEQTARNWIDGTACPNGLDVFRAVTLWPDDFGGRL